VPQRAVEVGDHQADRSRRGHPGSLDGSAAGGKAVHGTGRPVRVRQRFATMSAIPKAANSRADAVRVTFSGRRAPKSRPSRTPVVPLRAMPAVAPIHTSTGRPRAASVAVASIVLSPSSATNIAPATDRTTVPPAGPPTIAVP